MGIRELKKDEVLHTIGERVQKLDIVLKGTIRVSNSDGGMVLKTGAIIGAAEKPDEGYTFDYKADSDASVYHKAQSEDSAGAGFFQRKGCCGLPFLV